MSDWGCLRRSGRISASLYSSDPLNLEKAIKKAELFGAESLHIDIMDGQYAAEFGLNLKTTRAVCQAAKVPADIHFMVRNPLRFLKPYIMKGIRAVYLHQDAESNPSEALNEISAEGREPGLAFAPDADLDRYQSLFPHCQRILLLSIAPGSEQSFDKATYGRIEHLRRLREKGRFSFHIAVDGGIDPGTAARCLECGADGVILGRALFKA